MNLADELLKRLPSGSGVVAFVGAGGKTTAMFRLASEVAAGGRPVLVTTTTHLLDPRSEPRGFAGTVVFRPEMEAPCAGRAGLPAGPGVTLLLSREADEAGKVRGIHPSWIPTLRESWDVVLVEADGSRRRPLKAPGEGEPALPPDVDVVVGVAGLDALGEPMDERTVHRPERFARVTGCEDGAPITWEHLAALVRHPEGLFKGAPAARVLLLNKVDAAAFVPSREQIASLAVDRVLLCRLEGEPAVTAFCREVGYACR